MSVKTENITEDKENIQDDISDEKVTNEEENVDAAKLAALKNKLAKKENKMPPKIVEKKRRSIEFGVVGSGQAGSRLAESFYNLGYATICFNTAQQDLEHINIPADNKFLLSHGIGGAAKDKNIGAEAAQKHIESINELVHDKLTNAQVFLLCLSLGGGSGAGSAETMVEILATTGKPIAVITVLPMSTDDAQTKNNALETLSRLAKYTQDKVISNLIVVDNAKIETIYNDVGIMDFFKISNRAIVEPINAFNEYSAQASDVKGLDSMEFAKIFIDGEGLTVYGELTVTDYEEDTAIAEAVVNNVDSGLLASGFDLKQTRYAGFVVAANKAVWGKIPSSSVNYATSMVKDICGSSDSVYKGIYESEDIKDDVVKIYFMFSGLGLPDNRVKQLQKEAEVEANKAKSRAESRNLNLTLETGKEKTVSEADKIREKIKSKGSKFGKTFGAGLDNFRDLRKK